MTYPKMSVALLAGLLTSVLQSTVPIESFSQSPELPDTPFNYARQMLPGHFNNSPVNTPADNPVTDAGATLGRVLFYDVNLSANNTTACGSCHVQAKGFVDGEVFSTGFEGGLTGRNSMATANLAYDDSGFFWDERAATIEDQVLLPIQNETEMGMTLAALELKLAGLSYYSNLFEAAFGSPEVTSDRISKALAQFLRSMVSYRSRYDEGLNMTRNPMTPFPNYSASENLGKTVFLQNCARCHTGPVIHSPGSRTNGLGNYGDDHGKFDVTGVPTDFNSFKSPSLRNIELTGPYMHDGRMQTLEEVVEHYSSGITGGGPGPGGGPVPGFPPGGFHFSDEQKAGLVAFMLTLTDQEFISDPKFSDPFTGTTTDVASGMIAAHASLEAPYPNPANAFSTLSFNVSQVVNVKLEIRDIRGNLVAELFDADAFSGQQTLNWSGRLSNGAALPAGTYLLVLHAGDEQLQRQIVWMP